eukprot:CAMPEP_0174764004 /NCGR_PEP_ID=MMETSP1094-20130205/110563_1 /TAXON_ID=156173 /ORGANISM="Chrysochromulina brevifilum, Strain UTEX LB 985" /LENGTH=137 /DNA_ID=CAMNT_0015969959 /DNA_START=520 /DNA_END=933 /DNA_ORIENTATION=+
MTILSQRTFMEDVLPAFMADVQLAKLMRERQNLMDDARMDNAILRARGDICMVAGARVSTVRDESLEVPRSAQSGRAWSTTRRQWGSHQEEVGRSLQEAAPRGLRGGGAQGRLAAQTRARNEALAVKRLTREVGLKR